MKKLNHPHYVKQRIDRVLRRARRAEKELVRERDMRQRLEERLTGVDDRLKTVEETTRG